MASGDGKQTARPYLWMALAALLMRVAAILVLGTYTLSPGPIQQIAVGEETPGTNSEISEEMRNQLAFRIETGSVAHSLATGNGFSSPFGGDTGPTAWLGPVYPALCAGVFLLFGSFSATSAFVMLLLNSLFAALTCIPIYLIGERTLGPKVGLGAGWAWAVVPLFWQWPITWVWEMSLSALLLGFLFLLALRLADETGWKPWAGFGGLWGVAALTNPALLSFLPVACAWPAYKVRQQKRNYAKPVLLALVACLLVVSPWLVRNRLVFDQFVFLRSNFWFEFHLGNYDGSQGLAWGGKHPSENALQYEKYRRMGELGYVAEARAEALAFLRRYPGQFIRLSLKRLRFFWDGSYLRYGRNYIEWWSPSLVTAFSALSLLGLLLAFLRRRNGVGLYGLLLLFYPAIYYITYPQARYRHAIEPELLLLTVYSCLETAAYVRKRLRRVTA